jgi:hypothetical protein
MKQHQKSCRDVWLMANRPGDGGEGWCVCECSIRQEILPTTWELPTYFLTEPNNRFSLEIQELCVGA